MQTHPGTVSDQEFRVKSTTPPPELGSAIAHTVKAGKQVVLKAVGAGAINQAVKAIPIAQSFVSSFGTKLTEEITFFRSRAPEGEILGIAIRVIGS
ncbi:stage V sporulation protein S [Streptomyces malaysiensis]|uniref:Stage V sporulation protein S n=1 Tax=Streptomyces malaysiensis TaxID=92644 RepID=A0A7X6AZH9_STRMQ|nr:stage V sporulation protein S [Streptomyces malaysiensis]NIY68018.1 Stage V sporulation protein S [Streptomyces malaysiensis]